MAPLPGDQSTPLAPSRSSTQQAPLTSSRAARGRDVFTCPSGPQVAVPALASPERLRVPVYMSRGPPAQSGCGMPHGLPAGTRVCQGVRPAVCVRPSSSHTGACRRYTKYGTLRSWGYLTPNPPVINLHVSNILRVQTHSNPLTVKTYSSIAVPDSLLPSLRVPPPTHTLLLHTPRCPGVWRAR